MWEKSKIVKLVAVEVGRSVFFPKAFFPHWKNILFHWNKWMTKAGNKMNCFLDWNVFRQDLKKQTHTHTILLAVFSCTMLSINYVLGQLSIGNRHTKSLNKLLGTMTTGDWVPKLLGTMTTWLQGYHDYRVFSWWKPSVLGGPWWEKLKVPNKVILFNMKSYCCFWNRFLIRHYLLCKWYDVGLTGLILTTVTVTAYCRGWWQLLKN